MAGSFALNDITNNTSQATIKTGANVNAGGGDVSLTAANNSTATNAGNGGFVTHASTKTDHQKIQELAHRKFIARGGADGRDLDDWLEAEAECKGKAGTPNAWTREE